MVIKQVIDRSVFTLNYPHRSCFMGGISIAGNYHFLYITGTVAVVLTSKQESVGKNEPFQVLPPQCLWAAEIISSSWDPFQKSEAEEGFYPSPIPLQQAFQANQSKAYDTSYESSQLNCLGAPEYFWKIRVSPSSGFINTPWCWRGFSHVKS